MFGRSHGWGGCRSRRDEGFRFGPRGDNRGNFGGGRGFDGFGGGGRHGRGRMFGAGDLRLVLLALIAEKPSHGYELIRAIEAKFGGAYAPSPGAVYPTLTLLEEQDLVLGEAEDSGKKVYAITPEGRAHLVENEAAVQGVMTRMNLTAQAVSGEDVGEALHEAMRTLRHAIRMQRRWTPDEARRVSAIIEKAAREIVLGAASDTVGRKAD